MKKLFGFAVVFFCLISCHKGGVEPVIIPCLLTTTVTSSGFTYTYTYDGEKALTTSTASSGGSITGTFNYDGTGRITGVDYQGAIPKEVLTYTGENITKSEKFSGNGSLTDRTDYEYSGGQMIKIQRYANNGASKGDYLTLEYSGSSPDPIHKSMFYAGNATIVQEFTYGDKKSPFSAAPANLVKYMRLGGLPVDKNVIKIMANTGDAIVYTYEFNSQGYPTHRVETYSNGIVNTNTYTYNCK